MLRRSTLALLSLVLCAAPALADEATDDDRFHEAYVLEVVEGDIRGAAKAYLALCDDEAVSLEVRAEARFRFAVCTVLLGRPDEARLQLAELIREKDTPEATRARATSYAQAVANLGTGTELERKLQSLVFDLARENPQYNPIEAYRDFEIIGAPALPFLEKLVGHSDESLRQHAFRLLCRLSSPRVLELWTPSLSLSNSQLTEDVTTYVEAHLELLETFEAKLLALDAQTLHDVLTHRHPDPPFSLAFVKALLARAAVRDWGFTYLHEAGEEAQRWAVVSEALLGEDAGLAHGASEWIVSHDTAPPEQMAAQLWPRFLDRVVEMGLGWTPQNAPRSSPSGRLLAYAERVPTPLLLDSLEHLVEAGEIWPAGKQGSPLAKGLADAVVLAYEENAGSAIDVDRYPALLERWIEALPDLDEALASGRTRVVLGRLKSLLSRLPRKEGDALLRRLTRGPGEGRPGLLLDLVEVRTPADVERLVDVALTIPVVDRAVLLRNLANHLEVERPVALRRAVLAALPRLLGLVHGPQVLESSFRAMYVAGHDMPAEERVEHLADVLGAAWNLGEDALVEVLYDTLAPASKVAETIGEEVRYFADTGLAVVERLRDLPESAVEVVVRIGHHVLHGAAGDVVYWEQLHSEQQDRLAAYLLANLAYMPPGHWPRIAAHPGILPVEAWLPFAPKNIVPRIQVSESEADRVVRTLADERGVTAVRVLEFARVHASDDVAKALFDRLLTSDDAEARARAVLALNPHGYPAGEEVLERALGLALAEDPVHLGQVATLTRVLLERRPSARLFPAVRVLLAAKEQRWQGFAAAKALGQEALVPDLVPFLDSMDQKIRRQAREAIASIREIRRVKEEAARTADD